jgi:hypothetical protein
MKDKIWWQFFYETCETGCFVSFKQWRNMRNCLFRFKAKFRETTSLFRETRNMFRFVFREIRNETSFAGNPSRDAKSRIMRHETEILKANKNAPHGVASSDLSNDTKTYRYLLISWGFPFKYILIQNYDYEKSWMPTEKTLNRRPYEIFVFLFNN